MSTSVNEKINAAVHPEENKTDSYLVSQESILGDSNTRIVWEVSNALHAQVELASKRDIFDLQKDVFSNRYQTLIASAGIGSSLTLFAGIIAKQPESLILMPILAGLLYESGRHQDASQKLGRTSEVQIAEGYALQPLRIASTKQRNVAIAIHPRYYEGQPEPVDLTRERLVTALRVVADTNEKVSYAIVPGSTARRAGLTHDLDLTDYRTAVDAVTNKKILSPYCEEETAFIISKESASEAASKIERMAKLEVQVMAELRRRFPIHEVNLNLDSPQVSQTLLCVLRRIMINNDGRIASHTPDIKGGGMVRAVHDMVSHVMSKSDSFNPTIMRLNTGTGQMDSFFDLRSTTKLERDRLISGLSEVTMASDESLIQLAFNARQQRVEPKAKQDTLPPVGGEPLRLRLTPEAETKRYLRVVRRVGVVAAAATFSISAVVGLGAGVVYGIDKLMHHSEKRPVYSWDSISGSGNALLFRVDNHGMINQQNYWPQVVSGMRGGSHWFDESKPGTFLAIPGNLADATTPHLTVQAVTQETTFSLPIQEGTKLGAIKAILPNGENLPVTVLKTMDGQVRTYVNNNQSSYSMAYDLVASDEPNEYAVAPIDVSDVDKIDPNLLKRWRGMSLQEAADAVRQTFIYDANADFDKRLTHIESTNKYIETVDNAGRCKCDQCNTLVAMTQAAMHPNQNLAFVSGYYEPPVLDHTYLAAIGHAWLVSDEGLIDATASKKDANSVLPAKAGNEYYDKQWNDVRHHFYPKKSTRLPYKEVGVTVGIALALELERRRKLARSMVVRAVSNYMWTNVGTSALSADPKQALRLLSWHEYGGHAHPPLVLNGNDKHQKPTFQQAEKASSPNPESFTDQGLTRMQSGMFKSSAKLTSAEQVIVQRAARAIQYDRQHGIQPVITAKDFYLDAEI